MGKKRPGGGEGRGQQKVKPNKAGLREPKGTASPSARPVLRDAASWVDTAVFAGVLGMIIVTPWFRGLFFPMEQMVSLLVALILFAARWWAKFARNDYTFLRGPLDWAVFGLFLAYVASTFVAANVRAAIQEDMKYLLYFIVYWLVRELARDERRRAMVLGAIAVTGVWVSILGVGAAAGTFKYNGAFDGMRIFSAFQYPNTLAAYLTAAFACAVALWSRAAAPAWLGAVADPGITAGRARGAGPLRAIIDALVGERGTVAVPTSALLLRAWPGVLWAVAAYAILFTFVFTYSRGAWLLFPAVAALLIVVMPAGYRLGSLLLILGAVAAFAPQVGAFPAAVQAKNALGVWRAFLLGIPLAVAGSLVILGLMRLPARVKVVVLGGVAVGATVLFTVLVRGLPANILDRIRTINLETLSAQERIRWIADALRIVRDHPVLGAGGGGWEALYRQYQHYGYSSTQVHGHYAQVWVEAGTVGLLILLTAWILIFWHGWRLFLARAANGSAPTDSVPPRSAADGKAVALGGLAGALALGIHSAIDFNLSLAAVSVALWALVGVLAAAPVAGSGAVGTNRTLAAVSTDYRLAPRLATYGLTVLVAAGVASLLVGFVHGQKAMRALNAGRWDEARAEYERAVAADPFTASFHMDLGQVYEAQALQAEDAARAGQARQEFQRGLKLESYNANLHMIYGIFLLRSGDLEAGLSEMERSVRLNPYVIQRYEDLADALVEFGLRSAARGEREKALPLLDRALAIQPRLAEARARMPSWAPADRQLPAETPRLALSWGEALAVKGDLTAAEQQLRAAINVGEVPFQAEANLWLGQVLAKQGNNKEADAHLKKAIELDDRVTQQVEAVKRLLAGS